tara:strand:- start:1640 stop:2113 length:474 start_codon:yes stop_codon:yes gene_type:complete
MNDPSNVSMNDLRNLRTLKDVKEYADKNYPGWIKGYAERYSDDYPHLTCTWVEMAKMMKAEPAQIMLVSSLPHAEKDKENSSVLIALCDIFSRTGFMLRRHHEFQACTVCDALIPTKECFTQLTVKPPFEWRAMCRMCGEDRESTRPVIEEVKDDLD